jgi:MFS family permease
VKALMPNHKKLAELPSRKRPTLTGSLLFFLSAIMGTASAFWSYKVVLGRFSIVFHPYVILACLFLGAFFGLGAALIADEYDRLRAMAFVVAIFLGVLVPIGAYLILSFLAGPT